MARKILWAFMALLAFAVAGYSIVILFVPAIRPPVVVGHLANVPGYALAHFVGGAVAMTVGVLQLNSRLRARALHLHRYLGRVYLAGVLVGGIGGFVLAVNSAAGPVAQWGFGLLAVAWIASTAIAFRHIRGRRIEMHRAWMIRSYALTLAAVTLRLYIPVGMVAGFPAEQAYLAIAWLCWIPNLAVAEYFIRRSASAPVLPDALARTS